MIADFGNPRVLIVGAGPAGLAAAAELARREVGDVMIIDRDDAPGGLPRFCHHPGFGLEYARWPYLGPRFAARMVRELDGSPVRICTGTTLISLDHGPVCEVTGPELGYCTLEPEVVIVATGIREANRGNRVVPGVRPPHGILTTGLLQQLVHRGVALPPFLRRLVVVGTEHVSFSAILTARHAGLSVVAMVGGESRVQSYAPAGWLARMLGIGLHLDSEIIAIHGTGDRVTGVGIRGPGGTRDIACDGVLFSAGWIPETAALTSGPMLIDPRTGGPVIDQAMRTSLPGVLATGNVLRGVETSGFAALEGQRAGAMAALMIAGQVGRDQASDARKARSQVPQLWDEALVEPADSRGWRPARFRNSYERQGDAAASQDSRRHAEVTQELGP